MRAALEWSRQKDIHACRELAAALFWWWDWIGHWTEGYRWLQDLMAGTEEGEARIRAKLLAARRGRKQPLLDTKVLTGWNGLMIRGLALAGRLLERPDYVAAAGRAMRFVLDRQRSENGGLLRSTREGKGNIPGFVDDYAAIAHALMELNRASPGQWNRELQEIMAQMSRRFSSAAGAFFTTLAKCSAMNSPT